MNCFKCNKELVVTESMKNKIKQGYGYKPQCRECVVKQRRNFNLSYPENYEIKKTI